MKPLPPKPARKPRTDRLLALTAMVRASKALKTKAAPPDSPPPPEPPRPAPPVVHDAPRINDEGPARAALKRADEAMQAAKFVKRGVVSLGEQIKGQVQRIEASERARGVLADALHESARTFKQGLDAAAKTSSFLGGQIGQLDGKSRLLFEEVGKIQKVSENGVLEARRAHARLDGIRLPTIPNCVVALEIERNKLYADFHDGTRKEIGAVGAGRIPWEMMGGGGGGGASATHGLTIITASGDVTLTTQRAMVLVDASAGPVTVTIPSAIVAAGVDYIVQKIDATRNEVVVNSVSNIDGESGGMGVRCEDSAMHLYSTASTYGWIIA